MQGKVGGDEVDLERRWAQAEGVALVAAREVGGKKASGVELFFPIFFSAADEGGAAGSKAGWGVGIMAPTD